MTTDVLIIGGGMAGTAAALAAAHAGAAVALVRAGPGATALAAGAWPHAPPPMVAEALASAGVELVACAGALPHPHGHLVPSAVAPRAHAAAALAGDAGTDTLVCGIAGLPSFRAAALAALWADAAGLAAPLHYATITLADTPPGGWSAAALAALLEREPDPLADAIARAAQHHQASRVIVPAVLGTDAHTRVLDAVQSATALTVGEALGVAPSLPGWRLDRAMLRALDSARVTVLTGRVTAHTAQNGALSSVTVAGDAGTTTISASNFVLATGKFIGGGIATSDRFRDTVFGSDVAVRRFDKSFSEPETVLALTDAVRAEPQPVMAAGIATDDAARMLTADGDVVFSNMFAAGSVRGGVETASLDLGTAAHDGWTAGVRAGG